MNKLVFTRSDKMAQALTKKVPEFANADVRIGFGPDAREQIRGKVVLTDYLPDNMVSLPEQVVLCNCSVRAETAEKLDVDELAWNLRPFVAFKAVQLDSADAKASW